MTSLRKRSADLVETDIDGERVVMSMASGEFFALKDTGLAIWQLLDTATDRTALLARLGEIYEADEGELARDLDPFLTGLLDAGLLEQG